MNAPQIQTVAVNVPQQVQQVQQVVNVPQQAVSVPQGVSGALPLGRYLENGINLDTYGSDNVQYGYQFQSGC